MEQEKKEENVELYNFKKGFPEEMSDRIKGQSDIQLLFEYALDHLYQDLEPVDSFYPS